MDASSSHLFLILEIMKIFITGINGFIGSNLARYLTGLGHRVSGSVRESSDLSFLHPIKVDLFTGDIGDEEFLATAFPGQEIVYHVAALASDWGTQKAFDNINVHGTKNVAHAAVNAGVRRLIFVSSTAVYGLTGYRHRSEYDVRPEKNFPYAIAKQTAEDWLKNFSQEADLPITIIQPANVFGPNDRTFFIKFARGLETGMVSFINHGIAWTCPTYVENLAEALWLAATNERAIGETFIISDGLEITWHQYVEKICRALELPLPQQSFRFGFVYALASILEIIFKLFRIKTEPPISRYRIRNFGLDYHFSIDKAITILGYSPRIDIDEGIRRTVHWYKQFRKEKANEGSIG